MPGGATRVLASPHQQGMTGTLSPPAEALDSGTTMAASSASSSLRYRKTTPPGAGQYEVLFGDQVIGKVGRFRLSAGQFGSRWVATTPRRKRSGQYSTRDAAAAWLVEQARG